MDNFQLEIILTTGGRMVNLCISIAIVVVYVYVIIHTRSRRYGDLFLWRMNALIGGYWVIVSAVLLYPAIIQGYPPGMLGSYTDDLVRWGQTLLLTIQLLPGILEIKALRWTRQRIKHSRQLD